MLGGALPPVVATLVADIGQFSAKMGEARAEVLGMKASASSNFSRLASMGKAAALGLGAAGIAIGGVSVDMAMKFDQAMELVHTQAGASQSTVDALKQKVLDLAGATGQAPEELAKALFHVESAFQGIKNNDAMNILTQGAKLATISGANLDDTMYGLSSVMNTYGAHAKDAAKWAAFFNAVVGAGDMKMQDFNTAVGTGYFSAAQTFGVSAQSAGAALAFMTDRGQGAAQAATHLRMMLALIAAPSAKAASMLGAIGLKGPEVVARTKAMTQALHKAGLTTVQLAADLKKPDGIYVALAHLKKNLMDSGMSAEAASALLAKAFGGGKSSATIMTLLNNLGTLKGKFDSVGKGMSGKAYAQAFTSTTQQFATQVKMIESELQKWGIELGNYLIPKIQSLILWIKQVVQWGQQHTTIVKLIAAAIGGVLMVAMAAWIVSLGIAAAETIAATWPILAIIAVIALLAAGIYYLWTHWHQVWGWICKEASAAKDWIVHTWDSLLADANHIWSAIINWIISTIRSGMGWVNRVWDDAVGWTRRAWAWIANAVISGVNQIIRWLAGFGSWVWNGIVGGINRVLSWLGGIGSWFYNVGVNIINGIIRGVWSAGGALFSNLRSLASSALNAVKSALGINSPSKVFADVVGKSIPEGVAVGVTKHAHLAVASVVSMAKSLNWPAAGLSVAGANPYVTSGVFGGAGGGGSSQLTVNVVAQVDEGVLFKTTQKTALRYQARNGRPAFAK